MPTVVTQSPANQFTLVSAGTTNATLIKVGRCVLWGWDITNTNAAIRYVCFHDIGTDPVAGQSINRKVGIPASGGWAKTFPVGILFTNGLAITTVVNPAANDNTAVAASDLVINIDYL